MNLDEYIKGVYDTSEKYGLPHQLVIDLVDAQEYKNVCRGRQDNMYGSFEIVKRYLRIKNGKRL